MTVSSASEKFLIFGNGWVSGLVQEELSRTGDNYDVSSVRIEDREAVLSELDRFKPTRVINTAGKRGFPNADWCEDHKDAAIRSNVIGAANLVDCCYIRDIHITHFASACIYDEDEAHPLDGPGFTEEEPPNYGASFYSYSKLVSEQAIKSYPNVLILRLRNPLAADLHPMGFTAKLIRYDKIVNIPNSGTIMTNMTPAAVILARHRETGIFNFTNPGTFTHNEVMELAKKYIRPSLSWTNFTLEEQRKILKAPRTNAKLDASKLVKTLAGYDYTILSAQDALEEAFIAMKAKGYK